MAKGSGDNSGTLTSDMGDQQTGSSKAQWSAYRCARFVSHFVLWLAFLASVAMIVARLVLVIDERSSIASVQKAPRLDVALVLGAGISSAGQPSDVLDARIQKAVELHREGKVRKLLMSGDNSIQGYDEVTAMKLRAVQLGVPDNDVLLDYAGFRTLDSCVRLRQVFGQQNAIVVTQGFHLPRALHLCSWAGVNAFGVEAPDPRKFGSRLRSNVRELPASVQALLDAHVLGRSPRFLGPAVDINNPPPEALRQQNG